MHHVILGAGPAGVTAAETLRAEDANARITLVNGEAGAPYARMAIPYLLAGDIGEAGTELRRTAGHFDDLGIEILHGRAAGLDALARRLTLEDGREIAYDRLLIATGASPVRPPIEGLDLPGVHHCWTLEDARAIAALAEEGAPVVLMGAGFIGSIILEALVKRGVRLTVVEVEDRMVPRMMDEVAGAMLKRWCEHKGLRVATGTRIAAITAAADTAAASTGGDQPTAEKALTVHLSGGETIPARLVVIAAGVRSNAGFLSGTGAQIGAGLRVDAAMHTSLPHVYAAGDVAEGPDLATGGRDVLAIQPVAVEHGRIAGLNMAGRQALHKGSLPMNVLDTLGLVSASFGAWAGRGDGEGARLVDERASRYMRLEFEGDRLIGAQMVGMTDHIGMARGLIQTGTRLGAWKGRLMKAPERLAEAYVATAQGIGTA